MEEKRLLMNWGYMSYLEDGEGDTTLVFIHGAGNRGSIWNKVMEHLKSDFQVIAPDLPGHGRSSCILHKSIEGYAQSIREFLETLNLQEVFLIGHSMGGAITIKTVPQCPQVKGAVLVGTGAQLKVNTKLLKGLQENFVESVGTMARWCFSKGTREELIEEARDMMLQAGRDVLYRDMYACSVYSGTEDLKKFDIPTLVVCGEKDVMTPVDLSRDLVTQIKGSKLKLIPNSGHMVHLEQPQTLAKAIKDWWIGLTQ